MNISIRKILAVYVFAFSFLFASRPLSDGDFWFHLKTGEYVVQTGTIPRMEIFSFTNYGIPWIAHGWLSGLIFYSIYSVLGFNGLIFIFALLAALAFWIVYRRSDSHPFIRGMTTLLAVWAVMPNLGVRPRIFSLLFASIFLALLNDYAQKKRARAIWWLVLLMALWVNLHGGYLIGLALIGLTFVGILLDTWADGATIRSIWPQLRNLTFVLVGCFAAVGLNPYGLRMYSFPLEVLRSPVFQETVVDWLSPNFHQREMLPFALLSLLTVSFLALSPKRARLSSLLFFVATLYASLRTQRNILIFALIAAPLLADHFQSWIDSTSLHLLRKPDATDASRRLSFVFATLLLLPLLVFALKLKTAVYVPLRQETTKVPMKAVEHLKEQQITGNSFTDPNIWGGYLIWALPSNPVYIDGRDVYPQRFVQEFVEITRGNRDWREPFNRHGVKIAIVRPQSVLAREFKESGEWRQVFTDNLATVFVR